MRVNEADISPQAGLYPGIEPYRTFRMEVGGGHSLYVEECGRPDGEPVLVLHGGPGGGCSPGMRRFFDPKRYRAILFDQRGCGRSRPHASIDANTTWDLIDDIEEIREKLGIDAWTIFGGSWGATLALIYAITHRERVRALVLRGVFLMAERELQWFYQGGAGQFRPQPWSRFASAIPEAERDDVIAAYYRRLTSRDTREQTQFARIWAGWEAACATMRGGENGDPEPTYARAFARIECHYFHNRGWLDGDEWILKNAKALDGVPGRIVQGRFDLICPPVSSWKLHRAWPGSTLHMVEDAGHALSEPGIASKLVNLMDALDPV